MYFHYQQEGKESEWRLASALERSRIIAKVRPAFTTVLDLSAVPDDNDWSKVRYRGPLYFDFDADGDLELACSQFRVFLGKLVAEVDFDLTQATYWASGSKGFHVEIPQECFIAKPPAGGLPWLPYVYRDVAQSLIVDTLDLNVYTGKRGRMWRTPNVKRENGCYKVQLRDDEVLNMTPDLYQEVIKSPRECVPPAPASCNAAFAMMFDRARTRVTDMMRNKRKRAEKAHALLDPWKNAKRTPPTIEALMRGENLNPEAGFQAIAMQLSIYATSVGMERDDFVRRCEGLCANHVSDGYRYRSPEKRRAELMRMWDYMSENTLYEFDPGPIVRLMSKDHVATDLGVMDTRDHDDDAPAKAEAAPPGDDQPPAEGEVAGEVSDPHATIRRGLFQTKYGLFARHNENTVSICRASFANVIAFHSVENQDFLGFDAEMRVEGSKPRPVMLNTELFTTGAHLRKFLAKYAVTFQGTDAEAMGLMDILSDKARRGERVYVYPREGFFILPNPNSEAAETCFVYLTNNTFRCSLPENDPNAFRLKYRPEMVSHSYKVDIHDAPELSREMVSTVNDLFEFNSPANVASLIGWFVSAWLRTVHHHLFGQFPLLQIYGEAGAGKSQTVLLLSRLHWARGESITMKSATSLTSFALDAHVNASASAPCILDEWKPAEMKRTGNRYEKGKDVLKMAYIMGDVGERGQLSKGTEAGLTITRSKASAPIVFMGEAVESETAIVERSLIVAFTKRYHTPQRRAAFARLQANPEVLSAIGRAVVERLFGLDLKAMRAEMTAILERLYAAAPKRGDGRTSVGDRPIFNRAVAAHSWSILKTVLHDTFGDQFDEKCSEMAEHLFDFTNESSQAVAENSISEVAKVVARMALMSRRQDKSYALLNRKDYCSDGETLHLKIEIAYDKYREYCVTSNEQPLFNSMSSFINALVVHSAVTDPLCFNSPISQDGSDERVMAFSIRALRDENVPSFRG